MRKGPFTGISWLQLIAGALAAMTSAWVASYLGVAGTIIGAAVGSLVASVASALYVRGLDRGTTLITESGSVVSRPRSAGSVLADDESEAEVIVEGETIALDDPESQFSWKRVLIWAGVAMASALVLIGGYELATDSAFGNADNPTISRPWRDTGDSSPQDRDDRRDPDSSDPTTDGPTNAPTTAVPTAAPTTAAPTTAPTVAPAPAPTTAPAPEVPDPGAADE